MITLRETKGSELSFAELDDNFVDLDARTAEGWQILRGQVNFAGLGDPPNVTLFNGVWAVITFPPGGVSELTATFVIPADYVEGTGFIPFLKCATDEDATGTVRMGWIVSFANAYDNIDLNAGPATSDQIFSPPFTLYFERTFDPSFNSVGQHWEWTTTPSSPGPPSIPIPFVIPGIKPNAVVLLKLFRDGTHVDDTFQEHFHLFFVGAKYRSQGFGQPTI